MRQTLIFLPIFGLLFSCTQLDRTKVKNDTTTVTQQSETGVSKRERQILIEELKRLRVLFETKDKQKIADIFQFPLSDTSFSIYIDDSTFNKQFKLNGDKTTRSMLLQHFKEISESIWLEPLTSLLQKIPLDSLLYKDMLEGDSYIKTEPCFYSYKIEVIKDSVVLRMDMNSNRSYKSKKTSEDDIPENSSEICEHSFWWNFNFDGKKLRFKSIGGAD